MSVHETSLGQRRSIHCPRKTPASVGTDTDQPTNPIMPNQNQMPSPALARAVILRDAFFPTAPVNRSRPCVSRFSRSFSGTFL